MSGLTAKIASNLSQLIPSNADRFLVALSGGSDSVALLSLCHRWASADQNRPFPEAIHIHHGIRDEEADRDARHCVKICAKFKITLHVIVADVEQRAASDSISLETAGREIRRSKYLEIARARSAPVVVTGQHGDDQAETVLGNLLRGCGLRGLRGMDRESSIGTSGIKVLRPMLEIRKTEILQYLEEEQLENIEDSTNQLPIYRRNRLRLETIPSLQRENPEVISHLMRISSEAGRRWEILQKRIDDSLSRAIILPPRISLPPDCWKGFDGPEISDLIRGAIVLAFGEEGGLNREHLSSLEKLATGESRSASLLLAGERKATRCGGWIHIGPADAPDLPSLEPFQIAPVSTVESSGLNWQSSFPELLMVRTIQQGDKIPTRAGTIEELLRTSGVPPKIRQSWPVAFSEDGTIRWLPGIHNDPGNEDPVVSISFEGNTQRVDELGYHLLRVTDAIST